MDSIDSYRALIIEDDEDIASLVARTLGEAGIDSDVADNGLDGLWMARSGLYGVICLDLLLPEMNGYVVCRTLRAEDNHIPILMLTAKSGEYDETDGLEIGADDYLRKPFSPAVLVARVRSLLRRRATPRAPTVLERGDIALNVDSQHCTVAGTEVDLTPKEAALLRALMSTGDVPAGRDRLLDEVWGWDFEGDKNVVDVYLGYLRRKLGRDRIENVRGAGHRIACR